MSDLPDLNLDFETFSECDLKACGGHVYAEHPSTEVMCAYFSWPEGDPFGWHPYKGEPFPQVVIDHVRARGPIRAWNFGFFERQIWSQVLIRQVRQLTGITIPDLFPSQTYCTMTEALAMALPGKLETCAAALGLTEQKDKAGHAQMLRLSKPRKARKGEDPSVTHRWTQEEAPEKFEKMYAYCGQDVVVERAIKNEVRRMSKFERNIYLIDQTINDRGIYVDLVAVRAAKRLAEEQTKRYLAEVSDLTRGVITSPKQYKPIADWLRQNGVNTPNVRAETVDALLAEGGMPNKCRDVLTLLRKANKSSVAKLDAFLNRTCRDGRMRGNVQMNGAGSTRRFAARGAQLQNMPRMGCSNPDLAIEDMKAGINLDDFELMWGDPMVAISGCLRGMLTHAPER